MSESHQNAQIKTSVEPERTCSQGCNGCDDCTDFDHDDTGTDYLPPCPRCHGDGRDKYTDYLLPCPLCLGDAL